MISKEAYDARIFVKCKLAIESCFYMNARLDAFNQLLKDVEIVA